MDKQEQLQELLKIKASKEITTPKATSNYNNNIQMPHERKVEIGNRILKNKILSM